MALAHDQNIQFAQSKTGMPLNCKALMEGQVDVMNTTLQLILPCLNEVQLLASIGEKRIEITPDVPTVAELTPGLNISLWSGLFVQKKTPQDIRNKIISVAKKTMSSERALTLIRKTGASIYWQDSNEASMRILSDRKILMSINNTLKKSS